MASAIADIRRYAAAPTAYQAPGADDEREAIAMRRRIVWGIALPALAFVVGTAVGAIFAASMLRTIAA